MAWRAITEADVLTRISGSELTPLRSAAKAVGQPDPVADIISQVTGIVRGRVAACAQNTLGTVGTIPDELLSAALDIIVWNIMKRPAAAIIDRNDARKNSAEAAEALLRDVAKCDFALEQPAIPTSQVIPGGTSAELVRPGRTSPGTW